MVEFLLLSNYTLFVYFLLSNLIYLGLLILAIASNIAHQRRLGNLRMERLKRSPLVPPVALLVPAHNEEKLIASSVQSLLALDYPALEVIVVNDGSTDATLQRLVEEFHLLETDIAYVPEIPTRPVRGVYMSQADPRLLVVDKEAGGSKADAINAALNSASSPYVCVVDADAILERDALLRIMAPVLTDPSPVAAAGGIVRAVNGSRVEQGRLVEVRLPDSTIQVLQVIDYLRAFLVGREGWAAADLLLIISGAFGIFRRDIVRAIGGFRVDAIGEDLDLVVRMHRHLRQQGQPYGVRFIPDPVCWTEVPPDTVSLGRQRARWQQGLLEVMWRNRDMLLNGRYGRVGILALPYHWVFEVAAPVIELTGYTTMALSALLGVLSLEFFLQFLLFGYAFATLLSVGAVLQEELTYRRYAHWRDVARLIGFSFLEHFPYRQMQMWWRLRGMWDLLRGKTEWGRLRRVGFQKA